MCQQRRFFEEGQVAGFAHRECGRQRAWFDVRFGGRRGRPFEDFDEGTSGFGHGPGRFGHGFGGRERLFDGGELKLVILKLLAEQPSYGYQLIKAMEERLAGGYSPSAGVIYPTLTMIEEEGLATSTTTENNKKVYSLTEEGRQHLEANKERVSELFERIEAVSERFQRRRSPELMRAFANLRHAVMGRMWGRSLSPEKLKKIADAINAAAKAIEEL
jgi:DNA-binding PadR family transcriptional regulator